MQLEHLRRTTHLRRVFSLFQWVTRESKRSRLRTIKRWQSRDDESFKEDEQNKENNQSIELSAANINLAIENASYAFENMIISTDLDSNENLFRYSVTYDFEAFNHLIEDKSRFINEIILAYEWVKISNDDLLIEEYDTMTVNEKLNEKSKILHFRKTAYVSKSSVILVSIKLLKDEKALWNMHIDTIDVKDTFIFKLEEHFELYTIEYISSDHVETYVNFIESKEENINAVSKEISWKFHLRLDHCQSEIINQLIKFEFIELVNDESALKTVQCETCVTTKMHSLIFKSSSFKSCQNPDINRHLTEHHVARRYRR
jgi:hypothetical protein